MFSWVDSAANPYIGMVEMMEICRVIREDKKVGFLYLSPAMSKASVFAHYYNLK